MYFNPREAKLLNAYKTVYSQPYAEQPVRVITVCYAYVLSVRVSVSETKFVSCIFYHAFNGGMLAWYLVYTKYLGMKDNYAYVFLPYAMNVFNMYLMKNF